MRCQAASTTCLRKWVREPLFAVDPAKHTYSRATEPRTIGREGRRAAPRSCHAMPGEPLRLTEVVLDDACHALAMSQVARGRWMSNFVPMGVRMGETARMAGSKTKKSKRPTPAKSAPKRRATQKSHKTSTKPLKKASSAKKVAAKKKGTARRPQPQAPPRARPQRFKPFADKVQDCDAGTGIWFIVAGGIEHAVIQRRGRDNEVVTLTDAGVTEVVSSSNLFETADEARAARYR
jgi:hypothetical protein